MVNRLVWTDPVEVHSSSLVTRPHGVGPRLPVLYLLHGIKDQPSDWWSGKGQLAGLLAGAQARPMVIVMVSNGTSGHTEPAFDDFEGRFAAVRAAVNAAYRPDPRRHGLLGISMGAKQALSLVLGSREKPGFSVLALLSGMFQGRHLSAVHGGLGSWPRDPGRSLRLYFHYCGRGPDIARQNKDPLGATGDAQFFENNRLVCQRLSGRLRSRDDGMHNWLFWRPELAEFFRVLNQVW